MPSKIFLELYRRCVVEDEGQIERMTVVSVSQKFANG